MNWQQYIEFLQEQGFTGDGGTFPAVQKWLGENGFDTEELEGEDGRTYVLKTLFEQRPGRKMQVGAVEQKAKTDQYIADRIRDGIEEVTDHFGLKPKAHLKDNEPPDQTQIGAVRDRADDDLAGGFQGYTKIARLGEFFLQVKTYCKNNGTHNDRTAALKAWDDRIQKGPATTWASEGVGADGGFAVPPEQLNVITSLVQGEDSVIGRTDQYPLTRNNMTFPKDETTPWEVGATGTTGGIQAFWESEAGLMKQSKPALEMIEQRLRKCTILMPMTEELIEDSTAMGTYVTRKAGEVIDFKIGEGIFRGTGVGMPLGFLNGGSTIEVDADPAQATTGLPLTAHNVFDMWSRMYAPSRRNAVWWIHQDLEPSLFGMTLQATDASGGAPSGGGPIYLPAGNVAGSPFATLFGKPVIPTQHCSAVRTPGDIIFAAMDKYLCTLKAGGVQSATSMDLWFDQDLIAFKFRMRVDGQPWRTSPIPPRDVGANTLSDFITLADRT